MAVPSASSSSTEGRTGSTTQVVLTLALCWVYIVISAILINFNKFLVNAERFPYPVPLTTIHVMITLSTCSLAYLGMPSLFPSMEKAWEARDSLSKAFAPVSVLFVIGVVCSNIAYLYCNVAFLQFMKEWNVALVFGLSCLAGSQTCDRVKFAVILWIVIAACLAVTGDMKFSHLGFMIQVLSQCGETTRIVIQEWLLSGRELRLDPLTYQIFVGPPTLVLLVVVNALTWDPAVLVAMKAWWPYLLANGCCAAALNVTIAVTIKHAGGVAFVLAGVAKDIVIVTASSYVSGKWLNHQQTFGFSLALSGICYWGMLKSIPNNRVVQLLPKMLGMPPTHDKTMTAEQMPLLSKDKA